MSDAIIVALIAGVCSVIGQYFISRKKTQDQEIRDAQREQRQNDRMEIIEKKLDEHNGYAKKFGQIETDITKIQKDIEYFKLLRKEKYGN